MTKSFNLQRTYRINKYSYICEMADDASFGLGTVGPLSGRPLKVSATEAQRVQKMDRYGKKQLPI